MNLFLEIRSPQKNRYFTGKPCRAGHVAERFAGNRECVECSRQRSARDPRKAERTRLSSIRNREKRAAAERARYWSNLEASRTYHNSLRLKMPDKFAAKEAAQREKHRVRRAIANAKRRAELLQATPAWADEGKIAVFYAEARRLTELTGIRHEVDHILPLKGKTVCGLHVETNLQILTKSENSRKQHRLIDAALGEKP